MDGGVELDALAVGQAEHLVVIQHSVHVLYPEGIHGTIADDPLVVVGGVLDTLPDNGGHQTILPLQSELVDLTIELPHGHRLGVGEGKRGWRGEEGERREMSERGDQGMGRESGGEKSQVWKVRKGSMNKCYKQKPINEASVTTT